MRIAEEHLVFIQAALSPPNCNLAKKIATLRDEALLFWCFIMYISNGHVSQDEIGSNELITKYTYDAEKATEFYTCIKSFSNLTLNEQHLLTNVNIMYKPISYKQILILNKYAIDIINRITDFQSELLKSFVNCEIFINIYPDRIDHIIDENRRYMQDIQDLQNMNLIPNLNSINEQMIFWNENMSDHGDYTAHLLDPKEKELSKTSLEFSAAFTKLTNEAKNARNNPNEIIRVIDRSLQELIRYKEFYTQGVVGILNCKIKSLILPLAAEHDLRELHHYLKILYEGKNI